jgi:hypothetical protein
MSKGRSHGIVHPFMEVTERKRIDISVLPLEAREVNSMLVEPRGSPCLQSPESETSARKRSRKAD